MYTRQVIPIYLYRAYQNLDWPLTDNPGNVSLGQRQYIPRLSKDNVKNFIYRGIIFLVSHRNLLCIFYMTAIQNVFCLAVFFHRSVQNFIWNIHPSAEIANQIWGGKLFPVYDFFFRLCLCKTTLLHLYGSYCIVYKQLLITLHVHVHVPQLLW